jgi:hypothetical protein
MDKQIIIQGQNNRRQIKRLTKDMVDVHDEIQYSSQIHLINDCKREIERKLASYKHQDLKKNREFGINYENVVCKMELQELKCRYCFNEMLLNYVSRRDRETRQWTLDRINNDLGHTDANCHLACLKCNLQRRRTSDDAFLFTKQLVIKKV